MSKILAEKTILVTRPKHQVDQLCRNIQAMGAKTIAYPCLEISAITITEQIDDYHFLIFVSANAVNASMELFPHQPFNTSIIAIGPGTARALQTRGFEVNYVPPVHDSEGLLALPCLKDVKQKKIAIFCGENSKPLLKDSLLRRGALVEKIVCYRRSCPNVELTEAIRTVQHWQSHQIALVIFTSSESLANFWKIFAKVDPEWLRSVPLLVISSTMVSQAQQLNFKTIFSAKGASDEAICEALQALNLGKNSPT